MLEHEHEPLAALTYDESALEDPALVEAAAAAARLALENARLQAELRAHTLRRPSGPFVVETPDPQSGSNE